MTYLVKLMTLISVAWSSTPTTVASTGIYHGGRLHLTWPQLGVDFSDALSRGLIYAVLSYGLTIPGILCLLGPLLDVWRLVGSLHTDHLRPEIARTLNDKVFHDMSKEEVRAGMATESAEIGAPKTISSLRAFDSGTTTIPTKIYMAALSAVTFTTIVLMLIT